MRFARCFFLAAAAPVLLAQIPNPGASPGAGIPGPGSSATSGTLGSASPISSGPNQISDFPSAFVAGKVLMADGLPVPIGVPIVRVCFSSQRTVAITDSKGQFSVALSSPASGAMTGDASDQGGPLGSLDPRVARTGATNSLEANCELRADLAGYSSSVVPLTSEMGSSASVNIVLHRLANVEGTSVSATLYNAPADARKAYEKGTQSLQK